MISQQKFVDAGAAGYTHVSLEKTISADIDTPVAMYQKISQSPHSFLLESVSGGRFWGRFSILGNAEGHYIKTQGRNVVIGSTGGQQRVFRGVHPLEEVDKYLQSFRVYFEHSQIATFSGGAVGYWGYEAMCYIESRLADLAMKKNDLQTPDVFLLIPHKLAVFDNLQQTLTMICLAPTGLDLDNYHQGFAQLEKFEQLLTKPTDYRSLPCHHLPDAEEFVSSCGKDAYMRNVDTCRQHITRGDAMQIVISHRLSAPFTAPAFELYRSLRRVNPSPYMFYFDFKDFQVVGSSPETLVSCKNNILTLRPIAGTRRRGSNEQEDLKLERELLDDEKERAEHLMLIDLGRNDLGKVAQAGSVQVTEQFGIERYSHVMHLVSSVLGEKIDSMSLMDVLKSAFPAGTVTGAPKIRAMEIIAELENSQRNIYSGAVGYLGFHRNLDTAIAIRTAVIKDGYIHVQAGAGIVYDSKPEREWQETLDKAGNIIRAVSLMNQFKKSTQ